MKHRRHGRCRHAGIDSPERRHDVTAAFVRGPHRPNGAVHPPHSVQAVALTGGDVSDNGDAADGGQRTVGTLVTLPDVQEIAEAIAESIHELTVDLAICIQGSSCVDYRRVRPFSLRRDRASLGRFVFEAIDDGRIIEVTIDPFHDSGYPGTVRYRPLTS